MARPDANHASKTGAGRLRPGFGRTVFLQQGAHVTILDGRGYIITVNDAWMRFGVENGLPPSYRFLGVSYPEVCERAIGFKGGDKGAREALFGINRILATEINRFSLVYPCHAPDKQRWFLMYARPIGAGMDGGRTNSAGTTDAATVGAVVSHVDVTSLHLAGLVPDETASSSASALPPDAPSSKKLADALAQQLFPRDEQSLASIVSRLR